MHTHPVLVKFSSRYHTHHFPQEKHTQNDKLLTMKTFVRIFNHLIETCIFFPLAILILMQYTSSTFGKSKDEETHFTRGLRATRYVVSLTSRDVDFTMTLKQLPTRMLDHLGTNFHS